MNIILLFFLGFYLSIGNGLTGISDTFEEEKSYTNEWQFVEFTFILENVFHYYGKMPESIDCIIQFTEKCIETDPDYFYPVTENIIQVTLPFMKKNKEEMVISHTNSHFYINIDQDTFSYPSDIFYLNPCNIDRLVGAEPFEYYNFYKRFMKGRFFDEQGFPVIKHENLSSELIRTKKLTQQEYLKDATLQSYIHEGEKVPLYIVLEYKKQQGLFFFCKHESFRSDILFYKKMTDSLEDMCVKNQLSRIILLVPIYK